MRIGDGLVLAHQAAQFGRQRVHARFQRRVGGHVLCAGRARLRRAQQGQQAEEEQPVLERHRQPLSLLTSGSRSLAHTSGVSGPMCFMRTMPSRSMTKVSGTP